MEEKKKVTVKPEEAKGNGLSYDKLKELALQLDKQVGILRERLQQAQEALAHSNFEVTSFILSMCVKIKEHPEGYDEQFVKWCTGVIQSGLVSFVEQMTDSGESEEDKEQKEPANEV